MDAQHVKHGYECLKHATEKGGFEGALAGGFGVALTTAAAVGVAGLALTPLGWPWLPLAVPSQAARG